MDAFYGPHGRRAVTLSRNEILTTLNSPERYTLAVVQVEDGKAREPRYVRRPFIKEQENFAESLNCKLKELLTRSIAPA